MAKKIGTLVVLTLRIVSKTMLDKIINQKISKRALEQVWHEQHEDIDAHRLIPSYLSLFWEWAQKKKRWWVACGWCEWWYNQNAAWQAKQDIATALHNIGRATEVWDEKWVNFGVRYFWLLRPFPFSRCTGWHALFILIFNVLRLFALYRDNGAN